MPTKNLKQKVADDIRPIFNPEHRTHAETELAEFVRAYAKSAPKLATWAEQNIPEGLTIFGFPEASRQHLRNGSTKSITVRPCGMDISIHLDSEAVVFRISP